MGWELYLLFAVVWFLFYELHWKRRNLPKGPTPVPIIGNILSLFIKSPGEQAFMDWRKQFGNIYTFWMGRVPMIIVTEYKTMYDIFVKEADSYSGRLYAAPEMRKYMKLTRGGLGGVVFTDGDVWKELRPFMQRTFGRLGVGKDEMQDRVFHEISFMFRRLDKGLADGITEFEMGSQVNLITAGLISNMTFGYEHNESNTEMFKYLATQTSEVMRLFAHPASLGLQQHPDIFRMLPYFSSHLKKNNFAINTLVEFVEERLKERKDTDLNGEATDFLTAFLQERAVTDKPEFYNDEEMRAICLDMWIAGQDTTSTTITWGLAYLCNNPECIVKAQKEMEKVIGTDKFVNFSDRAYLPYTSAVVYEINRIANVLPINLFHRTSNDVELEGMKIPKGTAIVPQICCTLYDEKVFPNPKEFRPERFIDAETGKLHVPDEWVPFGLGKRTCVGAGMARMVMFLVVANLLNHYTIGVGSKPISVKRHPGLVSRIEKFKCKVERRVK